VGVGKGYYKHMCGVAESNLLPLIAPAGRLFLTTREHHAEYLELLKEDTTKPSKGKGVGQQKIRQ